MAGNRAERQGRRLVSLVAAVALVVWSVAPASDHVPKLLQVIADRALMIETHGHAHGLEQDIAWAMHGHSHDKADHDHSPAVLVAHRSTASALATSTSWNGPALAHWSPPVFRLIRPPRARA